jgi:Peroxiredoxin
MKRILMLMLAFSVLFAGAPVKDGYVVGDTAADFKLKNVDGKMISLADYKDAKGFIVIFDCNTCPYSKAYNERIIALNEKFASQGFPVLAINSNDPNISEGDSFEEMVKFAKAKKYKHPYLFDETQNVAKAFGATNTPHVFILSKKGNDLKVAYIGAIDDSAKDATAVSKRYVEDAVNALLGNKEVSTTKTKAIGCTIKWKNA